jgi:hypothetical protein
MLASGTAGSEVPPGLWVSPSTNRVEHRRAGAEVAFATALTKLIRLTHTYRDHGSRLITQDGRATLQAITILKCHFSRLRARTARS